MDSYIALEGPFDAILAFSQGASLAATYLIRKFEQDAVQQRLNPGIKIAVFLSGLLPVDYNALVDDNVRLLEYGIDEKVIPLPTANIWGSKDFQWSKSSWELSELCTKEERTVFIHDGGHEVPASKSKGAVIKAVHTIRRAVHTALHAQ